jgi:ATP-dependent Clp protease, protease subunit
MFKAQPTVMFEAPVAAMERWNPGIIAAAPSDETTINIYSTIGEYGDGQGMTAKIVNSILRKADGREVTINMNSPGGDFFEGNSIYNLLREYSGDVNIRIVGLAASAASIVAMGGDNVQIAQSGFFMIHNSWTIAMGNRHEMDKMASTLEEFDSAMASIYAKKTGIKEREMAKIMDAESWISGLEAVERGFAHKLLKSDDIALDDDEEPAVAALRKLDVALAKAGMPRSQRRNLVKELTGTRNAAVDTPPTPCAGNFSEALKSLLVSTQK